MKITSFKIYAIHLPLIQPFKVAYHTYDYMPSIILEMHTDEGITGFGEAVPDEHVTGESMTSAFQIMADILPKFIGDNPLDIALLHQKLEQQIIDNPALKAALDLAAYDILGKKSGLPIYQLLGGKTKEQLEYARVISIGTIEAMTSDAHTAIEKGFNILKLKVGSDYRQDIDNIIALRNAVPDYIEIRVDANQGWKNDAVKVRSYSKLKQMAGVEWIEQPFGIRDIDSTAQLRKSIDTPIMLDESIRNTDDLKVALSLQAADYINVKLMKTGGIYPAIQLIHLAESFGIPCQIGSMVESSIGSAAGYHLAMAMNNVTSTELTGPLLFSADIGNLKYEVPNVVLSEQPGLGIDVDMTKLKALTVKELTIKGENNE